MLIPLLAMALITADTISNTPTLFNEVTLLEEAPHVSFNSVKAILTDIEGTTTSISFVHDILFPYAKENVRSFLSDHAEDLPIAQIIQNVKEIADTPDADLEQVCQTLLDWMAQDKKITPLKALQGMMWEEGYRQGAFKGHLYRDAYTQMNNWKEHGLPLFVYSSGSIYAQKLLFSHTEYGDITPFFSGHFDTTVGSKKQEFSYLRIAEQMGLIPENILFLSDSIDELHAAKAAGMQTLLLSRDSAEPVDCVYPSVAGFDQINIE